MRQEEVKSEAGGGVTFNSIAALTRLVLVVVITMQDLLIHPCIKLVQYMCSGWGKGYLFWLGERVLFRVGGKGT